MARKIKLTGWAIRGRPFSLKEFNQSHIKRNIKGLNYSKYLKIFAADYKTAHFKRNFLK